MLHGMIPAAFFATLLRRYLDSLSQSSEYVAPSSTLGGLGTSAVVATVGIAAYGLTRMSRKKPETLQIENNESIGFTTPPMEEPCTHVNRRIPPKKVSRKRHKKNKKWFLKHMRHYKSKYGRQIGKLMNQFLGVPLVESVPAEPVDLDSSDDEDDVDLEPFDVFESPPYNGDTDERSAIVEGTYNGEDSAAPSYNRFEDDDGEGVGIVGATSSSLDLKDLLRDNFEMQRKRRSGRSKSSESKSSSGSYKSGCSEDNMVRHSRSSSSKRNRLSARNSRSRELQIRGRSWKNRVQSNSRKTRSGRCYSKSSY